MLPKSQSRRSLVLPVGILLLASLACNLLNAPQGDINLTSEQGDEEAPPPADADMEPPPANNATLDLDDLGLYAEPDVEHYFTRMLYTFQTVASDGSPVDGRLDLDAVTTIGPPPASRLLFSVEGQADLGQQQTFEIVEIGDTDYVYSPQTGCLMLGESGFENPYNSLLDAGGILGGEAQLVASAVTVNGVLTNQYKLDNTNIDTGDPSSGEVINVEDGELYVALEGGYVVRVVLVGRGYSELLSGDPSLEGDIFYQLDFEPTDQPPQINPPQTCGDPQDADYPMMDDAFALTDLAGVLQYKTNYAIDQVVAFYKSELLAEGWSLSQELVAAPTALLTFDKGSERLTVAIGQDTGSDALLVTVGDVSP